MCIMLTTPGRRLMALRAIAAFQAQTYENRRLFVLDSCLPQNTEPELMFHTDDARILLCKAPSVHHETGHKFSIGELRNSANDFPFDARRGWEKPDILAHWDDDDWSHPLRLEEQVTHLEQSQAPVVGYNEMLFWNQVAGEHHNEAWLYSNRNWAQPLGTSLVYWRSTWLLNPFQSFHPSTGAEDVRFLDTVKPRPRGRTSISPAPEGTAVGVTGYKYGEPRMVATVHGANTSSKIDPTNSVWTRVPEWDGYCRAVLGGHWKPAPVKEIHL